ncbi:C-factor-like [Spea bombifrons]|uniref:C-factor-like n=1 Tax=Spea bombifrons TaxID=233779 RepID=UPI00234A7152|nr:C-factor-like [Spea bombifrons]
MSHLKIHSLLVTGSNRGIGLEFVKQFLKRPNPPDKIFATCRDPDGPRSQELKKLAEKHSNVKLIKLDATDPKSIIESAKHVEKHLNGRGLDLLINNAGVAPPNTLHTQTAEDMMEVYKVNVVGPMLVSQAYYNLLKKSAKSNGFSAIVHISTLGGSIADVPLLFEQFPVISYRCSKAALNMLSRCQGEGYKQDNIMSIAIHPGWVQTDLGGEGALLTTETSVVGMLKVIYALTMDQSGTFVDWEGKPMRW